MHWPVDLNNSLLKLAQYLLSICTTQNAIFVTEINSIIPCSGPRDWAKINWSLLHNIQISFQAGRTRIGLFHTVLWPVMWSVSVSQLLFRSRDAHSPIGAGRTEGEGKAGEAAAVASRAADPSDGRTLGEHSRTDGLALSIGSEGAERARDLEVCSKDGLHRSPSNLNLVFF